MKANQKLIQTYLRMLTMSTVAAQDDPMADLADFDEAIDEMAAAARAADDEDLLRLSIDSLIARPEGRLDPFKGMYYGWPEDEMVALLTHAYARIWPDYMLSMPGDEIEVDFVEMSDAEWAAHTGRG